MVGRRLFYNNSVYDGPLPRPGDPGADDRAIAPDKRGLLPGEAAGPANVSGYVRGINGVMIDFAGPVAPNLGRDDFEFRAGAAGDPSGWAPAPPPSSVVVRPAAAAGQPTRVVLTWSDWVITNRWLRVTVKANERTRLAGPDVSFFGHLAGETGDAAASGGGAAPGAIGFRVSAIDLAAVKRALGRPATVGSPTDVNRDGRTDAVDLALVRRGLNQGLAIPAAPSGPLAPAPALALALAPAYPLFSDEPLPRARRATEDLRLPG